MPLRLGAVTYLNARPLVYGLEADPSLRVRFDVPARCADLLHGGEIDLGLIPSIEYLRAPAGRAPYAIVPDLAIASRGPVASVAIYTTRPVRDIRSIALDTSSRTSVALTAVLCRKVFGIAPQMARLGPNLPLMLAGADAALIIGDIALLQDGGRVEVNGRPADVEKVDLGEVWTSATGLPFVYAFWAGPTGGVVTAEGVARLQQARDQGVAHAETIGRSYFDTAPEHQALGARYLRDNIKYHLGPDERRGLELFYRYAADVGVVEAAAPLRFF